MREIIAASWHGLSTQEVETRLSIPGSDTRAVREAYEFALTGIRRTSRFPQLSDFSEGYIRLGGASLAEVEGMTAQCWGWGNNDKAWEKVPLGGRFGLQWGQVLLSRESEDGSWFRIGLWVPGSTNRGFYAIHSLDSYQRNFDTPLKAAILANAMWVHALEMAGRRDILSEWGIRTRADASLMRNPDAPLYDPRPQYELVVA